MAKHIPSIFNDVIGPVMRGPSSSHVAAASRIGQLLRMSCPDGLVQVEVDFDPTGSLAESHSGHGSDMGLISGLLGMELVDPRVIHAQELAEQSGLKVKFHIVKYGALHPNNYRMRVTDRLGQTLQWEAVSLGGGMISLWKLEGCNIDVRGDFFELLLLCHPEARTTLAQRINAWNGEVHWFASGETLLLNLKAESLPDPRWMRELAALPGVARMIVLKPILPTPSRLRASAPFSTAREMLEICGNRTMWELACIYEGAYSGKSNDEILIQAREIAARMRACLAEGLRGTSYPDRLLDPQAWRMEQYPLFPSTLIRLLVRNITAIMEVKSAMGVIVAAPTAGACACLPGTLLALAETMELNDERIVQGMLAAGLTGIFIVSQATFSAEVAGCQAECGAASAMTAAAIVQMLGGSARQCIAAASMALQNVTGLVCDPVANRVEIPCLGKNVMGGANAVAAASMALAGFHEMIPLDETIHAMLDIGKQLPLELRCTCGGLGKTPTATALSHQLRAKAEDLHYCERSNIDE